MASLSGTPESGLMDSAVAIIGTREPDAMQNRFAWFLARRLSDAGCNIHTGGAYGIDEAAMRGSLLYRLRVFLPWGTYNKNIIPPGAKTVIARKHLHPKWFASVLLYHPAPDRLSESVKSLHARNYGIIESTQLVIAFPGPGGAGGTGQGIRIAQALRIPVLHYNKGDVLPLFDEILGRARQILGLPIPTTAQSA
jgi:predicted Rossmann-fold nucleotide-binding protein